MYNPERNGTQKKGSYKDCLAIANHIHLKTIMILI